MKKLMLIAITFVGSTLYMNAQDISENALGLRFGGGNGFGAEVSYQRAVGGDNNRLELDLGLRSDNDFDGFKLAGIYQWVWNIDGAFNWYAGPGAGLASYSYDNKRFGNRDGDSETFLFLAGQIGIEYAFDFPLQLSLDARPEFGFGNSFFDNNGLGFDIALGVRYQF